MITMEMAVCPLAKLWNISIVCILIKRGSLLIKTVYFTHDISVSVCYRIVLFVVKFQLISYCNLGEPILITLNSIYPHILFKLNTLTKYEWIQNDKIQIG